MPGDREEAGEEVCPACAGVDTEEGVWGLSGEGPIPCFQWRVVVGEGERELGFQTHHETGTGKLPVFFAEALGMPLSVSV